MFSSFYNKVLFISLSLASTSFSGIKQSLVVSRIEFINQALVEYYLELSHHTLSWRYIVYDFSFSSVFYRLPSFCIVLQVLIICAQYGFMLNLDYSFYKKKIGFAYVIFDLLFSVLYWFLFLLFLLTFILFCNGKEQTFQNGTVAVWRYFFYYIFR